MQGAIHIDPSIATDFSLTSSTVVTGADLVVIVTARPVPAEDNGIVPGYASCLQVDHWNRCTVGAVNIVPRFVQPDHSGNPGVVGVERAIALRQILHLLGGEGMAPTAIFVSSSGAPSTEVKGGAPHTPKPCNTALGHNLTFSLACGPLRVTHTHHTGHL